MATIAQLRGRSEELFTELLTKPEPAPSRRRGARAVAVRAPAEPFSWFDPEDALRATTLSFRLAALAASRGRPNDGLQDALDHVAAEARTAHPEEVRQGFALFVTHNQDGRRLLKPRTVTAAPGLFNPPGPRRGARRPSISIGGFSPGLDYWREDPLANEHHQHWHEVYPYTGLPPRDFKQWLTTTSQADLVAILDVIEARPDWADVVASAPPAQLAGLFAQVVNHQNVVLLPPRLYQKLFHLNDRQGELFFYMHQQMLARYDAELLSSGLARVEPFGPSAWGKPIAAGHDPVGLPAFGRRDENRTIAAEDADRLRGMSKQIDAALSAKQLRRAQGGTVPIDPNNIGEAVEASASQLTGLDPSRYPGLHNSGHGAIAKLSRPAGGVMRSTVTAIRDQAFWQWHKFVDDCNARWQEKLDPYEFDDAPKVLVRDGLAGGATTPWASPDVILCRTADLPAGKDPAKLGEQLFGGAAWDTDFTQGSATSGAVTLPTRDELLTSLATSNFGGKAVSHLTHEPFSYFLRIENRKAASLQVTVRIYLVPADLATDRRAWMEMDKFLLTLPAKAKVVAYRPDTEASIVKRPAETGPATAQPGGGDPEENSYCDCGWPYTLLLPRGTQQGLTCRLLVLCTDAKIDKVDAPEHCGSMSYCGAVARYPDARDMGYPFSRPFAGPKASAIRDAILGLDSAAARTVRIRHV